MPISPTRMNLINTRRSIKLASKGYDILKKKKEVLVMEFLKLLKDSTSDRDALQKVLQEAYKSLSVSSTYVGDFELEQAANYVHEPMPVKMTVKNVMGVKIPEIDRNREQISVLDRGYSLLSTSVAVDDVNEAFNETINTVVDVAKREQGLKRLVVEIDKVKQRVNALEYILLPRLNSQSKYISMRLDEMDRDTFSALKHIKRRLSQKEK